METCSTPPTTRTHNTRRHANTFSFAHGRDLSLQDSVRDEVRARKDDLYTPVTYKEAHHNLTTPSIKPHQYHPTCRSEGWMRRAGMTDTGRWVAQSMVQTGVNRRSGPRPRSWREGSEYNMCSYGLGE